jgi:hypothetical protein
MGPAFSFITGRVYSEVHEATMSNAKNPKLTEDGTGRKKLAVSLGGGRYQLSLDDSAVVLLEDALGYGRGDPVSDLVVRVFVATGDAWFPHQRDYRSVVSDVPETRSANDAELEALARYLRSRRVPEVRAGLVRSLVANSRLTRHLDPADVAVKELPTAPPGIFDEGDERGSAGQRSTTVSGAQIRNRGGEEGENAEGVSVGEWGESVRHESTSRESGEHGEVSSENTVETREYTVFDIPGIGKTRGNELVESGWDSVDEIAETRPAILAESAQLTESRATVAVKGARELVGDEPSTATRLAAQTGVDESKFDDALSQLAAAGVPPSAAASTLRELFGPSVADISAVDGRMAYFLHDAGYTTPWDIVDATREELETVDYLGSKTATTVQIATEELLEKEGNRESNP